MTQTNPYNSSGVFPLYLLVYTDSTKATQVAEITSVSRAYQRRDCNEPWEHQFTVEMEDENTNLLGSSFNGIAQGHYYELWIGDTSPQTRRMNGYVQTIGKTHDMPGSFEITGASAAIHVNDLHSSGHEVQDPKIFSSIIDFLNGVQSPAGSGIYPPGYRGILTDTGHKAVWKDGKTPAFATTAVGDDLVGATTIHVGASAGFTTGNWIQVNATDSYVCTGKPDGTHVGIYPPLNAVPGAGWTVADLGYTPVGLGHKAISQWESELLNLNAMATNYGVPWTDTDGSTRGSGTIYIGPMQDDSGLTIWGGENLRQDLITNHGAVFGASGHDDLNTVNAGLAQQYGYAMVDSVTYTEDFAHVKNLYWLVGKGSPDHGGTTIASLVGGPPFTTTSGSPSAPINGWTRYQPENRLYFIKSSSKITFDGQTYFFIAYQREGQAVFQYGVADLTGVVGNASPPFGVCEDFLHLRYVSDAGQLLGSGIGHLQLHARPVPSYAMTVRHPMSSGAVPAFPRPGQLVTVNYTGEVEALGYDTNSASVTYGQIVSKGTYTFLSYPPPDILTSDPRYKKLKRVVAAQEEFTADGEYVQTLTFGQGQWHSKEIGLQFAAEMEKNVHNHPPAAAHSFKKVSFDGIPWILSQGAVGANTGWVQEDTNNRRLAFYPGGTAVADVQDVFFFSDQHGIQCTLVMADAAQWLQLWFSYPFYSPTFGQANAGSIYGVYQIAGSGSGKQSGFFTTSDGSSYTSRGALHNGGPYDANGRLVSLGTYHLALRLHGHQYQALTTQYGGVNPVTNWHHSASWQDGYNGTPVLSLGTIGLALSGGSSPLYLYDMHAKALHPVLSPKAGVPMSALAGTHPSTKTTRLSSAQYGAGAGAGGLGIIMPKAI